MSEFTEIAHAGGKVELTRLPDGQYSIKYTHSRATKLVYQQVCVGYDYKPLTFSELDTTLLGSLWFFSAPFVRRTPSERLPLIATNLSTCPEAKAARMRGR